MAILGEGGMGAVYRAEDTRLARDVAHKVLPDGRNLLATRWATDGGHPAIVVVSISDGSRREVVDGYKQAIFVESGYLVAGTP